MKSVYFTVAAVAAGLASAQDGLPDCAKNCVSGFTTGNQIGGCQSLDIACICSSPTFLSDIACCLAGVCSTEDQAASVRYAQDICATAGVTVPDAVVCASASSSAASATSSVASSESSATSSLSSSVASATSETGSSATSPGAATQTSNAANVAGVGAGVLGGLAAALVLL